MNAWKKYALVAVMVAAAMFAYNKSSHNVPPDLRDAPNDETFSTDFNLQNIKASDIAMPGEMPAPVADYAAGNDPLAGVPEEPIEWITIPGGKFMMGADNSTSIAGSAGPRHEVAIKTFEMSKTAVTTEQYAECVLNHKCTEPGIGGKCNWGKTQRHPINCVDWVQANQYARFAGGRLPTEAEWEYAARSGGKDQRFPWGNESATCDKAVMLSDGLSGDSCGNDGTRPVCSKPAGNTEQGLCDMTGNVSQWVQDKFHRSYMGAPVDGSAFEDAEGGIRVIRGGSFYFGSEFLQVGRRARGTPDSRRDDVGFRLVRASR